jgi:hypothetical protein
MSPRLSEQTPLLPGVHPDSSGPSPIKIRNFFILALDKLVFVPSYPTKLAVKWLERKLDPWGQTQIRMFEFIGLWFPFTFVFVCLTALMGVHGPFLFLNAIFCLSFFLLRMLEALYRFRGCRFVIRAITVGAILFSLWYVVDLRLEFTPADLPPLSNSSSIRILDVWPAGKRWGIEADLRTVRLEDNPAFEALSYEWGDPRKSHSISVRGKRFRVTANLWNALHNVRHETEARALWVDAISIDQTNLDEKSSQLPLMSLIYQRARSVLISLGKHTPPRWVEKSDPSTWRSAWVVKTADEYWETTAYWLKQLMIEEYWKRCWVVQEIGSGLSIEVYTERKPIPWDKFVELTMIFASKNPISTLPNRVLRFDSLRKALYHDGETYVLRQLLETFKDSFCSVNLDKILAFAGMAVDCQGECLPVDYAGGMAPLYEALIYFQNSTTHQNADRAIEMVYFAALVRRLLSRQQAKVVKEYKKPGWLYQPETWSYYWCGDDDTIFCAAVPETLLGLMAMEYLRAPFSASKDLQIKSSIWIPDTAEVKDDWTPGPGGGLAGITALGAIVGKVRELGPTYAEYLRHPNAAYQWNARLSQAYPAEPDQRRARGLNARLLALLGPAADYRLADMVNLPSQDETGDPSSGLRLFLGGDDIIMGLAPSNARVGDRLCQFWNSSAIAILRSRHGSDGYDIVGRGAMLQHGEEIEWDVPVNKTVFLPDSSASIELGLDLVMLNYLSFDTVNLVGSQG